MSMVKSILEALFWIVIATVLIVASMFVFGWGAVPVIGYLAAVATLVMFPMVLRMITMVRRRRGAAVIAYLEQAVRLNLPLPRMLAAARRSEGGVLGERLGSLQKLLEGGTTLGTALRIAVPEMGAGPPAM